MTLRAKMVLPLAFILGALGIMVAAQTAGAYARPKGATPIRVATVPAYAPCTAPNDTHGPPLAFQSCNPPVPTSNFLTVGTPDTNGANANSVGFVRLDVKVGTPSDVLIRSSISDVRCTPATAASVCNSPNAADGPDYSGELQGTAIIRITDTLNGPSLTDPATVQDEPFPVNATCANTADTSIGGLCSVSTSANAVVPGAVQTGKRAIVQLDQIQVNDGGADGVVSTLDNTLFETQGLFIP